MSYEYIPTHDVRRMTDRQLTKAIFLLEMDDEEHKAYCSSWVRNNPIDMELFEKNLIVAFERIRGRSERGDLHGW